VKTQCRQLEFLQPASAQGIKSDKHKAPKPKTNDKQQADESESIVRDVLKGHREHIRRFMLAARRLDSKNHFARVLGCRRTHLLFEKCNGYCYSPIRCNSRWCEYCAAGRSAMMALNLEDQLRWRKIRSVYFHDDEACYVENQQDITSLRHFVFTVRKIPYHGLKQCIEKLRQCVRRLTRYFQGRNLTYIWKIEVTFNKTSCHPHIHIAVNSYIPIDDLFLIFKKHVIPFVSSIKFAARWQCSLNEMTKYTTKPSSWDKVPNWAIDIIWRALQGVRLIGCSSDLRLMPREESIGYIVLGCLEKIADNPDSAYQGIAVSIMHEDQLYKDNIRAVEQTGERWNSDIRDGDTLINPVYQQKEKDRQA